MYPVWINRTAVPEMFHQKVLFQKLGTFLWNKSFIYPLKFLTFKFQFVSKQNDQIWPKVPIPWNHFNEDLRKNKPAERREPKNNIFKKIVLDHTICASPTFFTAHPSACLFITNETFRCKAVKKKVRKNRFLNKISSTCFMWIWTNTKQAYLKIRKRKVEALIEILWTISWRFLYASKRLYIPHVNL